MQHSARNSTKPILSVVVPTRQAGAKLRGLLESLAAARKIAGRCGSSLQVVIQDSESSDDTLEIASPYLEAGDILVSRKDSGIYQAMNRGVDAAAGEWTLFMGADDQLLLSDVCALLTQIKDSRVGVVVGNARSGQRMLEGRWGWRLLFGHTVNHQACFYRTALLRKIPYPEKYGIAADYWINLTLYLKRVKVICWNDRVVSEYGAEGTSSRNLERSLREQNLIRAEILGVFGRAANRLRSLKQKLL